ncbi:MAG: oxidoreductase [Verrucomicrobiales bacterium]|nr:oxidoreductase [Verrucomicrobiales bacterium]
MDSSQSLLGGAFTFPGTPYSVRRMGYGAMQLAGPGVFGPPRDRAGCVAVLREAIARGVNHIDTSDFYGPHVTNEIIREALHPYPEDLVLVTKVGVLRGGDASWKPALRPEDLRRAVHDNLGRLGLEALPVVNLRVGGLAAPDHSSIAEPFGVLADLQKEGLIRHLGLSNVSPVQLAEVRGIAPVVCIQNFYNIAHRADDAFIDDLTGQGIAYVPFFPLGGFSPLQSRTLSDVASWLGLTSRQLALAWLLQQSPNILLIPGTSSLAHLTENLAAAGAVLPPAAVAELDQVAQDAGRADSTS